MRDSRRETTVFVRGEVCCLPPVLAPMIHVCLPELSASDWQGSGWLGCSLLLSAPSAARGKVALQYGVSLMFAAINVLDGFGGKSWLQQLHLEDILLTLSLKKTFGMDLFRPLKG